MLSDGVVAGDSPAAFCFYHQNIGSCEGRKIAGEAPATT
jgi:hypothetical protein